MEITKELMTKKKERKEKRNEEESARGGVTEELKLSRTHTWFSLYRAIGTGLARLHRKLSSASRRLAKKKMCSRWL